MKVLLSLTLATALLLHPERPMWLVWVPGVATYHVMFDWHPEETEFRLKVPHRPSIPFFTLKWAQPTNLQVTACGSVSTALTQAAVQTAVTNIASGGVVCLPQGTSPDWTLPVTNNGKKITFLGAGMDVTTIVSDINDVNVSPLTFDGICATPTNFVNVGGFSMKNRRVGAGSGFIALSCVNAHGKPIVGFRAHHLKLYGDSLAGAYAGGRYLTASAVYGLFDHITQVSTSNDTASNISATPDTQANFSVATSYHMPSPLGTQNLVMTEDSTFDYIYQRNGATDNYAGTTWGVRYSDIRNNNVGNHGPDSANRGTRSFEVYRNLFRADGVPANGIELFGPRSATGVVWGNTVKNTVGAGAVYIDFFSPRYYGGMAQMNMTNNAEINFRAPFYWPDVPWGMPWTGLFMLHNVSDNGGYNLVSGAHPIDGNQQPPGHMDAAFTRTLTTVTMTAGSKNISCPSACFVTTPAAESDTQKDIESPNLPPMRVVMADFVNGSAVITSSTANFSAGDVGRAVVCDVGNTRIIPGGAEGYSTIVSVADAQHATIQAVDSQGNAVNPNARQTISTWLVITGPWIDTVTDSTHAILHTPASTSGSNVTLKIGWYDQGYPLADQVGRGSFPVANAGLWPTKTTGYSEANYEALDPTYLFLNHWQSVNGSGTVLSDVAPTTTGGQVTVGFSGNQAYIKRGREYYDDADVTSVLFANLPATCTVNDARWVTDRGGNWNLLDATSQDGALYKCTSTNVWTLFYTPLQYPHPLQYATP